MSVEVLNKVNTDQHIALENSFKALAKQWGVDVQPLSIKKIKPTQSVRLKCQIPLCEYYDVCKVCPPNIPSVTEFREALKSYTKAFLVILREKINDINLYRNDFSAELKLSQVVSDLERAAFEHGYYLALGLCVGGCKLCKECTPPGKRCLHPFKARPSPEGFGIDITKLAREAGAIVEWPPKKQVSFIGLVLV